MDVRLQPAELHVCQAHEALAQVLDQLALGKPTSCGLVHDSMLMRELQDP